MKGFSLLDALLAEYVGQAGLGNIGGAVGVRGLTELQELTNPKP